MAGGPARRRAPGAPRARADVGGYSSSAEEALTPLAWLLASALASSGSPALRLTVEVRGDDVRIVRAVPDDGVVEPGTDLDVVAATGRPIGGVALPPLARTRSVILPGSGGHGQQVSHESTRVRVRVPWPDDAAALVRRGVALPLPHAPPPPPVGDAIALRRSGPSDARLDLVFLAEGYRAEERAKFDDDVAAVLDHLDGIEPWGAYAGLLNTWSLFVPSTDSGIDQPDVGLDRDSAFACDYGCDLAGVPADRLICCDEEVVSDVVDGTVPFADGVMILVNEARYGGSGGLLYSAAYTGDRIALQVAAHELGHTLVTLWDEYGYGLDQPEDERFVSPNCAPVGGPLPWEAWLDGGAVDWSRWDAVGLRCDGRDTARGGVCAFPVCSFEDWVRPTQGGCMMHTLQDRYCPVCREAVVRALWRAMDGEGPTATPPPGTRITVEAGGTQTVAVDADLGSDGLDVVWSSGGRELGEGPTFEVTHGGGVCGELTATLTDRTPWVRADPDGAVGAELTWPVAAGPCCGCAASPGVGGAWALGLLPLVLRRRRA
jgi:hypothetical protein